ncbi:efflux RND transporter permease subunit [Shigella flexneri]
MRCRQCDRLGTGCPQRRDDQRQTGDFADDLELPEAKMIDTVDRIRAELPELQQTIPAAIDLQIAQDRSPTIRASLEEVEQTLVISVALVILVVFLFLRSGRASVIPAVAVPVRRSALCRYVSVRFSPTTRR